MTGYPNVSSTAQATNMTNYFEEILFAYQMCSFFLTQAILSVINSQEVYKLTQFSVSQQLVKTHNLATDWKLKNPRTS